MLDQIAAFFTFSNIMLMVYALNAIIAFGLIFLDNKSPAATMAWIMVLFMIPIAGLVLYMILSQNIARQQIFKMSESDEADRDSLLNLQREFVNTGERTSDSEITNKWRSMITMNLDYADSLLLYNDSVELLYDGQEMFNRLCDDILNAQHTIKLCYFIIKDDFVGKRLLSLLTQKAKEGVKVRLMMDALGSKSIGRYDLLEFKRAGGRYAFFFKPIIRHMYFRINYRNHRKIAIIDNEIAHIGGFNIAKEYLGYKKKFGYWRDTQMIIRGNSLMALNERFYKDWRCASGEKYDIIQKSIKHSFKSDAGSIPIQVVSSGPDSEKEQVKMSMIKMISGASRSIRIQTPYLVPDDPMLEAIAMAARSGVDVKIMIPCIPDHPFVYRTTLYNAGKLIEEGVKIYIYENGFLHAKTLTVDDEICTTGSTNFDIRSFKLNFESNAFVYDAEVSRGMNAQFDKDLKHCRQYTQKDRDEISFKEKLLESVSRLLAEIL